MMRFLRFRLRGVRKKAVGLYVNNKQLLLWGLVASVIVPSCVALSQFFVGELLFNHTAISVKAETNRTLKKNLDKAPALRANVNKLLADENLALVRAGEGDNNLRVVLDALPVTGDPATFATSLQDVVLKGSKVTITKLSVKDTDLQGSVNANTPQTVRFSVELVGDSASLKAALLDMERTIRPIQVTSLSIRGSEQQVTAKIAGVTYYLPERTVKLESSRVKRP